MGDCAVKEAYPDETPPWEVARLAQYLHGFEKAIDSRWFFMGQCRYYGGEMFMWCGCRAERHVKAVLRGDEADPQETGPVAVELHRLRGPYFVGRCEKCGCFFWALERRTEP